MTTKPLDQRPASLFINTLGNHLYISLIAVGISEAQAQQGTKAAIKNALDTFRGTNIYLSKKPKTAARQAQVLEDLKTLPAHEVDRKYKFSRGYAAQLKKKYQQRKS